jgi:hypothetical protein
MKHSGPSTLAASRSGQGSSSRSLGCEDSQSFTFPDDRPRNAGRHHDRPFNAGRQHDQSSVAGQRRAQNEPATERHEAKSDFEQCQTPKGKMLADDDDDGGTRFNYVVKLGNYDGTSSLEAFLEKFKNPASYYRCIERDRVFYLRACLDGAAGQILWDANENASFEQIVRLLRSRFGNEHQAEGYRAELRSRRRKRGEKLQDVCTDIRRLMSFAYPGPTSETSVRHRKWWQGMLS